MRTHTAPTMIGQADRLWRTLPNIRPLNSNIVKYVKCNDRVRDNLEWKQLENWANVYQYLLNPYLVLRLGWNLGRKYSLMPTMRRWKNTVWYRMMSSYVLRVSLITFFTQEKKAVNFIRITAHLFPQICQFRLVSQHLARTNDHVVILDYISPVVQLIKSTPWDDLKH